MHLNINARSSSSSSILTLKPDTCRPPPCPALPLAPTATQEEAAEKREKYKEGKFILEKCAVALEGRSGDGCYGSASAWASASGSGSGSASSGGRGRFGAGSRPRPDRCGGHSSIIGWGADNAPFADGGRW